MNRVKKVLNDFGLSDSEVIVYLDIVKSEETSPFAIAKNTQIPRTTVYDVMTSLALKGLIEIKQSQGFEKQQTKISAKNPSILRTIINEKRQKLSSLEVDVVDILPELKEGLEHKQNADFRFYPGIKGVKQVFEQSFLLEVKTDVYAWDQLMPMDFFGREYMNALVDKELKIRERLKVRPKTLIPLNNWTKHVLSYQYSRNSNYLTYHDLRHIEQPAFDLYQDIYVYGNTVVVICAKKNEAWGMIIKSKLYAQTMKNIFLLSWQTATPVTKEFIQSLGPNEFLEAEIKRKKVK